MTKANHTLESLLGADDTELARIAAEDVMGWELSKSASAGNFRLYENGRFIFYQHDWYPATDRNQSGELLGKCAEKGAEFKVSFARINASYRTVIWRLIGRSFWNEVPGNDARSETIAAILAAQTLEGGI